MVVEAAVATLLAVPIMALVEVRVAVLEHLIAFIQQVAVPPIRVIRVASTLLEAPTLRVAVVEPEQ